MPFLMSFALEPEIVTLAWTGNTSVQFPLNIYATKGLISGYKSFSRGWCVSVSIFQLPSPIFDLQSVRPVSRGPGGSRTNRAAPGGRTRGSRTDRNRMSRLHARGDARARAGWQADAAW